MSTTVTLRRRLGRFMRRAANASWLAFNAGVTTLGALLAFGASNVVEEPWFVALGVVTMLALPARRVWEQYRQRRKHVDLAVGAKDLVFTMGGEEIRLAFEDVRGVLRSGDSVWLQAKDESIWELKGLSEESKRELEERLPSTDRFSFVVPARRTLFGAAVFAFVSFGVVMMWGIPNAPIEQGLPVSLGLGAVLAGWLSLMRRARHLKVGVDGVHTEGRFMPHGSLELISSWKGRLMLVPHDGPEQVTMVSADDALAAVLDERRNDAVEAEDGAAFERRGGETAEEWLVRVRRLFDEAHYRESVVSVAKARKLLRAPTTTQRVRVAAAVALAAGRPEEVDEALDAWADEDAVDLVRRAIREEYADGLDRL